MRLFFFVFIIRFVGEECTVVCLAAYVAPLRLPAARPQQNIVIYIMCKIEYVDNIAQRGSQHVALLRCNLNKEMYDHVQYQNMLY